MTATTGRGSGIESTVVVMGDSFGFGGDVAFGVATITDVVRGAIATLARILAASIEQLRRLRST